MTEPCDPVTLYAATTGLALFFVWAFNACRWPARWLALAAVMVGVWLGWGMAH